MDELKALLSTAYNGVYKNNDVLPTLVLCDWLEERGKFQEQVDELRRLCHLVHASDVWGKAMAGVEVEETLRDLRHHAIRSGEE